MDNIREDMLVKGVTENDAKERKKWRNLTRCGDPLMKGYAERRSLHTVTRFFNIKYVVYFSHHLHY
jgi:hypothetical protein